MIDTPAPIDAALLHPVAREQDKSLTLPAPAYTAPDVLEWDHLSEPAREKNVAFIRELPCVLSDAGFQIHPGRNKHNVHGHRDGGNRIHRNGRIQRDRTACGRDSFVQSHIRQYVGFDNAGRCHERIDTGRKLYADDHGNERAGYAQRQRNTGR